MNYGTIEEIVAQLKEWSDAYYAGDEQVSDQEYDLLEDELRIKDPNNAWFSRNRETAAHGTKVPHIYEFIGSLDKIHSVAESRVLTNANKMYDLSAKLDGTSLIVYFKDGAVDYAATRGDGYYGIDATKHYRKICEKYIITVPTGFTGAIRGEVVFRLHNWEVFKAKHPEAKAPRNSGTGLINQKDVQDDEALLDYIVYDVISSNIPQTDRWDLLDSFGYPLAPHTTIYGSAINDNILGTWFENWKRIFPCDGIVIRENTFAEKYDSSSYRWKKIHEAYKFQAELKECEIEDITWQLGRTGKLTPVLKIKPVEMSGAIVTSITAHNAENVKKQALGKGAKVLAFRSGEVIPTLHKTLQPATFVALPERCPYCGEPLEWTASKKDLMCLNDMCPGKAQYRIYNFIQVMCDDIRGIGDAFLQSFVEEIKCNFGYEEDEVLTLDGFLIPAAAMRGETFTSLGKADNLVAEKIIDRLLQKRQPADKLFLALGIKLLGVEAAKRLASQPLQTQKILQIILSGDLAQLPNAIVAALPGQLALATSIYKEAELVKSVVMFYGEENITYNYNAVNSHYYAITGALSKPRNAIQKEFEALGWMMTDNMQKAEVLITDNPNSNSSKNQKARALGKVVISEEDFRATYL